MTDLENIEIITEENKLQNRMRKTIEREKAVRGNLIERKIELKKEGGAKKFIVQPKRIGEMTRVMIEKKKKNLLNRKRKKLLLLLRRRRRNLKIKLKRFHQDLKSQRLEKSNPKKVSTKRRDLNQKLMEDQRREKEKSRAGIGSFF